MIAKVFVASALAAAALACAAVLRSEPLVAARPAAPLPAQPVGAQGVPPSPASPHRANAVLVTELDAENKGPIGVSQTAMRRVSVKNISPGDVTLRLAAKSCVCLVDKLESSSLAPGQEMVLTLSVAVADFPGMQTQFATYEVTGPAGNEPIQTFTIRMTYLSDTDFVIMPHRLMIHVFAGEVFSDMITVRSWNDRDPGIGQLHSTMPGVTFDAPAELPENPLVTGIRVHVRSDRPGRFDGAIRFTTNSVAQARVEVPIVVHVQPAWTPSPAGFISTWRISEDARQARTAIIQLMRRTASVTVPARAVIAEASPGIDASLRVTQSQARDPLPAQTAEVRITLDPARLRGAIGSDVVHVLDTHGRLLVDLPVVWFIEQKVSQHP